MQAANYSGVTLTSVIESEKKLRNGATCILACGALHVAQLIQFETAIDHFPISYHLSMTIINISTIPIVATLENEHNYTEL